MYSLSPTPTEISQQLAQRHKLLRKQLKFSQAEMAERSGVSLGSLKRFETTGQISLESLLKLAHLLDRLADFEELFQPQVENNDLENLFISEP